MNILQTIFTNHYEEVIYSLHPRQTEIDNIQRLLDCGDPDSSGAFYVCPDCGAQKFVPFHCHSRFCPSCGTLYAQKRATTISLKLINCSHRHCVFTIPEELRLFFLQDRSLLNSLFHSVASVLLRVFSKLNKHQHFTPGFVLVLHTFGRDLKWNPHIHCLISEGGPPVTLHLPVLDFISRLIRHIPEKHFKMIRYYGIYAKHHRQEPNFCFAISPVKRSFSRSLNRWRNSISIAFGYDPLDCPCCGSTMEIMEIWYKKTALYDQLRKVLSTVP